MTHVQSPVRVLLVGLGLGWCADLLFYGNRVGISVPLFVLLLVGALFVVGKLESVRSVHRNLWLMGPIMFFASMVFVRANAFLTFLNIVVVIVLLSLLIFFYAEGRVEHLGLLGCPVVLGL